MTVGGAARRGAAVLAAAAVLLAAPPPSVRAQAAVQRVEVRVTVLPPLPHPAVVERLALVVESVADRLLTGRAVEALVPAAAQLGATIAEVVGRVATGYALDPVVVQPGAVAVVEATLHPVEPVIREVAVRPGLDAVPAAVRPLAAALLAAPADARIRPLYAGLPQAALPWAEPLLEGRAAAAVEAALAGYTAAVRVRAAAGRADVVVAVSPRDSRLVRNIGVRFRSSSIPTMLLDQHGPAVASMAGFLQGLPVAFAQAHAGSLAELVTAQLADYAPARRYRVVATAVLEAGETAYVTVIAESLVYRGRVEAHLNVGTLAPGPAIVGRLGRLVHPRLELFTEAHLVPNTLSMEWHAGAEIRLTPSLSAGAAYTVVAREVRLWSTMQLGLDTAVRGVWTEPGGSFEGALTYRFNAFLSGELVATSRGAWWLRLISNL